MHLNPLGYGRPGNVSDDYEPLDAEAPHTAAYVWPVVLRMMPTLPCRVLELGCGNGVFASELVRRGHAVTGLDASQSGIMIAKQRESRVSFHNRSVYDPTPEGWVGQFDVVVSLETIEHLYIPGALVERGREALRPGGMLFVSTPYHGYVKNLALAFSGRLDRHFTVLWDRGHIKFFSKKTLGELLRREGFVDVRCAGCGRVPWLWKSMVAVARKAAQ
jgi:2-polyprenyl-3-methyl-5-hydroxy-6-metoxy-1,4-benzoquinol methylase